MSVSMLGTTPPIARDATTLRWARFLAATEAEGPGRRAALWLQGCDVKCPGCFNPHLWAHRGGAVDAVDTLADRFVAEALSAGSEGLTLLGGEPFDQADAASAVARRFRDAGLTVMTFTGYRLDDLERWSAERSGIRTLLAHTDLLADGPYLRDQPDGTRPWIGSRNQRLRALTPAYADEVARIEREGGRDRIEVRIGRDGAVEVNGWADDAALAALLDDLGTRIDRPSRKEVTR